MRVSAARILIIDSIELWWGSVRHYACAGWRAATAPHPHSGAAASAAPAAL